MPRKKTVSVDDIKADDKNFNVGSDKGRMILDRSLKKLGANRSIVIDKNNVNMAGNKTLQAYKNNGGQKLIVVETDGTTLVAVKRTDIDINTKEGREIALADNQTALLNYVPDSDLIEAIAEELNIDTGEWGMPQPDGTQKKKLKEEDIRAFDMTHVLISFPPEKLVDVQVYLEAIKKIPGVEYEQGSN